MGTLALVGLLSSGCGSLPGSAPSATSTPASEPAPSVAPSPSPSAAAAKPTASPAPKPTETPATASHADTVWVGNTDGEGVYVRKTPVMVDRVRAYPDGTPLTIIGDDAEGDGQHWKYVKTPDGLEGYVPAIYTTDSPP